MLAEASEQMEKGNSIRPREPAKLLLEKPDSIDAYRMLQRIYWEKNDLPAQRNAIAKLLSLEIKATTTKALCRPSKISETPARKASASCGSSSAATGNAAGCVVRCRRYLELTKAYPAKSRTALSNGRRTHLSEAPESPRGCLATVRSCSGVLDSARDWQPTIDRGIAEAKKALSPKLPRSRPRPKQSTRLRTNFASNTMDNRGFRGLECSHCLPMFEVLHTKSFTWIRSFHLHDRKVPNLHPDEIRPFVVEADEDFLLIDVDVGRPLCHQIEDTLRSKWLISSSENKSFNSYDLTGAPSGP